MAKEDRGEGIVDRLVARLSNGLDDLLPDDPEFAQKYPHLWAFLTCRVLGDGRTKERAKLMLQIREGDWAITLSDAALRCSYPALGSTVQDALDRLEAILRDPDALPVRWKKHSMKLTEAAEEKRVAAGAGRGRIARKEGRKGKVRKSHANEPAGQPMKRRLACVFPAFRRNIAMPNYRLNFIFTNNLNRAGWAETWYAEAADHAEAQGKMDAYVPLRSDLMTENTVLAHGRASNVDPPRDSLIKEYNTPGTIDPVTHPPVTIWDALLVRKDRAEFTNQGRVFLHDVPQDVFLGRDLNPTVPAYFATALAAWVAGVVAQGFQFRITTGFGFGYISIAFMTALRLTEHRVGRPFDVLRGRRMIA